MVFLVVQRGDWRFPAKDCKPPSPLPLYTASDEKVTKKKKKTAEKRGHINSTHAKKWFPLSFNVGTVGFLQRAASLLAPYSLYTASDEKVTKKKKKTAEKRGHISSTHAKKCFLLSFNVGTVGFLQRAASLLAPYSLYTASDEKVTKKKKKNSRKKRTHQ